MSYKFSTKEIRFGAVLYDQLHTAKLVLYNNGKVDFDFSTLNVREDPSKIRPGEIVVSPLSGHIPALNNVTFTVTFLPGVPERFCKRFEIQIAHFEADAITLVGEAVHPRITLSLPRDYNSITPTLQDEARHNLDQIVPQLLVREDDYSETTLSVPLPVETDILELQLMEAEVDRLLVKEFATKNAEEMFMTSQTNSKLRYVVPRLKFNIT